MSGTFCSDFDARLAHEGPAAVFLPDREGLLRFDAEWTRDAWERHPGPHPRAEAWTLLRDRDTRYVMLALVTAPTLLPDHPRMDVRAFPSRATAEAARDTLGQPPLATDPW
jgi:hypothetical protein